MSFDHKQLNTALDNLLLSSTMASIDNIAYSPQEISDMIAYLFQFSDKDRSLALCLKQNTLPYQYDQLRQQKQELGRLYDIIDSIPANIYWKNTDGKYLGVNKACLKLTPYATRKDIIGKTLCEIIHGYASNQDLHTAATPEWTQMIEATDNKVMANQEQFIEEEEVIDPTGSPATYLSMKQPMYTNNTVTGMVGFSVDVTKDKVLEQQLQRSNEAKSEFIRNMGHDLRTPITGMLGIIDEIQQSTQSSDILQKAALLQQVTEALLGFANAALQNVNLADSTAIDNNEVFSIKQAIDHTIQMLSATIEQKKLQVSIEYADRFPEHVLGPKNSIERVLLNIISNAVKFTNDGSIRLDITTTPQNPAPDEAMQIHITVTDTGIGIPKEQHQFIFEKFMRVNPSYAGQYTGTGLGLYVSKKMMQKIGGSIDINSKLNKGTCVKLVIPVQITTQTPAKPKQAKPRNPDINYNRLLNILVVEDNLLALKMAENMLRHHLNCQISSVHLGKDALDAIKHNDYDLILMDIGLPDTDGIEVSRLIRNLDDPKKAQTPIIALSGHSDTELAQRCLQTQINRVLCKPLRKDDIYEMFELL